MRKDLMAQESNSAKSILLRVLIVVIFGIAFAYIEAAVVVYLRVIFHPAGFTFPLEPFAANELGKKLLLTEIGREVATLVLIFTGAWLIGRISQEKFANFMIIFAVWDIFYYIWLKLLIDWPASIMDWDILFLIPLPWASPLLVPLLVSITLIVFAIIILYRCSCNKPIKVAKADWAGFILAALIVVVSLCTAGAHISEAVYESYFSWPVFALGLIAAIILFIKCLLKSPSKI
ncbi:MAG: hypothetical protein JXB29_06625 [Sedimentisphaerales bacterium]|nr:hypothetical protein [Sedimentisphaerales bacterium]